MSATLTNGVKYRVRSRVYMGGGTLSTHRTLAAAERFIREQDAAIRHLNRHGGTSYHDCRIEEWTGSEWVRCGGEE